MGVTGILFLASLGILIYMVALNLFYTVSLIISAVKIPVYDERSLYLRGFSIDHHAAQPVSILVPAYNEEKNIVDAVRSFLALDYGDYEVVVANDGSTDGTLESLVAAFEMEKVEVIPSDVCESKAIKDIYFSRTEPKLVLVDKENGGKADAQNAAARVARSPYICMVDGDTLLDKYALRDITIRLAAEPNVVALGGTIRVSNGCRISNGVVTEVRMPRKFIERVQILEYLRAFLFGRVALATMKSLMIISGAFGVFRRDAFMKLGGWNREAIGEDMDAVVRLHRMIYEEDRDWKIDFVPDPVSWTQVPMTWKSLGHQRERWQRGLNQVMMANLVMFLNPRYRAVGLVGYPYFLIFEMLSAIVEFACYPLTILCFIYGIVDLTYVLYFLSVVMIWGLCISFYTILVHEKVKYPYGTVSDLKALLQTAILENLGYRQIHSFWRLQGIIRYVFDRSSRSTGMKGWTSIERASFVKE
jgi:cellulose synthase/poly-beta-1,6-N-acetylglucosamine synthase-like glycosyltransferase